MFPTMSKSKRLKWASLGGLLALFGLGAFLMAEKDETIAGYAGQDMFQLVEMNGKPVSKIIMISFEENGRVTGQAPCNRYFATQDAPLPWFKIGPIGATKMACPDLGLEAQYFELLGKVSLAEIAEDVLLLSDDNQVLLSFTRIKK